MADETTWMTSDSSDLDAVIPPTIELFALNRAWNVTVI